MAEARARTDSEWLTHSLTTIGLDPGDDRLSAETWSELLASFDAEAPLREARRKGEQALHTAKQRAYLAAGRQRVCVLPPDTEDLEDALLAIRRAGKGYRVVALAERIPGVAGGWAVQTDGEAPAASFHVQELRTFEAARRSEQGLIDRGGSWTGGTWLDRQDEP